MVDLEHWSSSLEQSGTLEHWSSLEHWNSSLEHGNSLEHWSSLDSEQNTGTLEQ